MSQTVSGQWQGTLTSVTVGGTVYGAREVLAAERAGRGVRLLLSTSDPSGRRLIATVAPGKGGTLRVDARPEDASGVATMLDSFASSGGEAFHGFGGRHNAIDQRGNEFYNYLQQENISSGIADGVTSVLPTGPQFLFPNGEAAAYYVQSSFVSSDGYGFLLDRDEISEWRLASDRADAWQVESYGPRLEYVVAPGDAPDAIGKLTALTGRHRLPPNWALGTILDRAVQYLGESPADYAAAVADDIAQHRPLRPAARRLPDRGLAVHPARRPRRPDRRVEAARDPPDALLPRLRRPRHDRDRQPGRVRRGARQRVRRHPRRRLAVRLRLELQRRRGADRLHQPGRGPLVEAAG